MSVGYMVIDGLKSRKWLRRKEGWRTSFSKEGHTDPCGDTSSRIWIKGHRTELQPDRWGKAFWSQETNCNYPLEAAPAC
jgi:hypothetical protein